MKTEQHDETYDLTSFKANQASGGGGGGGGVLNCRKNFQISDNHPPPFSLEKVVFSPLLGQSFPEIRHFS